MRKTRIFSNIMHTIAVLHVLRHSACSVGLFANIRRLNIRVIDEMQTQLLSVFVLANVVNLMSLKQCRRIGGD